MKYYKKQQLKVFSWIMGVVFLCAVLLRLFVLEIYTVERNSMNNTFFDGDKVVVYKFSGKPVVRNDVVVFHFNDDVYIKRCIGLPGETIEIVNGKVFINGKETGFPAEAVLPDTLPYAAATGNSDLNIVMFDLYGKSWNLNNYGPYVIPGKGMTLQLTKENLKLYRNILKTDQLIPGSDHSEMSMPENGYYTFANDYYFVLGDNRPMSDDSRILGAVNSKLIVGKVGFSF